MASPPIRGFVLDASHIARAHTYLAGSAFLSALLLGSALHFTKIVKNGIAGYPEEWFPSVSATIGDWYPERNVFQILIALASGPRFALVLLQYFQQRSPTSSFPAIVLIFGLIRTLSCGGWVYITSSDDHDIHDVFMILYMVCNIPWMFGTIYCTSQPNVHKRRLIVAATWFFLLVPLVYFFIQHKVHEIPGAYTRYAFFEWGLIFFDVCFDAQSSLAFREAKLKCTLGCSDKEILKTDRSEQPVESSRTEIGFKKTSPPRSNELNGSAQRERPWRDIIAFISDLYLSFVFWSIFTSLVPTLFYFSVWELGIAGHELAVLSTLSPVLLGFRPFREWASSKEGLVSLQALSLVGLTAFLADSPSIRLLLVAPSASLATLAQGAKWIKSGNENREPFVTVTALGFLMASASRLFAYSNNPIWPNMNSSTGGTNFGGAFLALLSLVELAFRSEVPSAHFKVLSPSKRPLSFALGSILFILHSLFSNPETTIAWSWTGYTNGLPNGPEPIRHGCLTILAQCVGVLLAVGLPEGVIRSQTSFAAGCAATYALYAHRGWVGYAGGLALACWSMAVFPLVLKDLGGLKDIGRTLFNGFGVYVVFIVASTFTVAYAFVPGGQYFRERTDLILILQTLGLIPTFCWTSLPSLSLNASLALDSRFRSFLTKCLGLVALASVLGNLFVLPAAPPVPFKPAARILTAGIWTLHFGMDNANRDSQWRVAQAVNNLSVDVLGLLESDLHRPVFGNRDLTRHLASELGYYVDIGPGPNQHTWGAALLSKFPIVNTTHHLLPSPHGELAPAIEAVLNVYGTHVTVVVAHNGQEEDALDRELQSTKLAEIMAMAGEKMPVIFLGYVVTMPHMPRPHPYEIMVKEGNMHDIDEDDWDRWCEYILYRGLYRTSYARVSRGLVTDTEFQIGQFVLPRHGHNITEEETTREQRHRRSWKEDLPEDFWMPMEYYDEGLNGHFYHVFDTPLYYKLPENAVV
ncbi:Frag1/DRAM/Sfk1 family-domain-containing protein [Flagelloscypha sp. PMI_526]|nr:Frag1/DRAM/Sfk1 family-domain-containing protein [Flagelloscypha sp. PMI_526]